MVPRATLLFKAWVYGIYWWVGAPVFAVAVLSLTLQDIGPAWTAHTGGGVHGTFEAQTQTCHTRRHHRSCQWRGSWTSDDGTRSRVDVGFGSGGRTFTAAGETAPAVDTGDRVLVFPVGGGSDWKFIALGIAIMVALLVVWAVAGVRTLRSSFGGDRRTGRVMVTAPPPGTITPGRGRRSRPR